MNATAIIRRLRPDDAAALVALRREALEREPLAFAASPADDRARSVEFVRSALHDQEQAVFGHFDGHELTGMIGVIRESKVKHRHKARVWGMYVAPRIRQRGVGRALLEAVIAHSCTWPGVEQLHLSVTTAAPAAAHLYDIAGFQQWGREPRALACGGVFVDESHRVLELREREAAPHAIEPRIRRATRADIAQIVRLLADDPLGAARERFAEPLPDTYLGAFASIASDPNHELVVAEHDSQVIAVLQLTFIPSLTYQGGWRALIEGVRVSSTVRGQGIGERLLRWAIERAKERGCRLVQLTTDKRRPAARRFYERLGFVASHEGMKLHLS